MFLLLALSLSAIACSQNEDEQATPTTQSESTTEANVSATPNAKPPETENYSFNEEIPCEEYRYEQATFGQLDDLTNITGIGQQIPQTSQSLGVQIITDYESYATILAKAFGTVDSNSESWVNYFHKMHSAFRGTKITEETFEEYDLLMVDFYFLGAIELYPRLENLTIEDGKVSVDLLYDSFSSSTADNKSVLYFIPIPKGCTEAEVVSIPTTFDG